MSQSLITLEDCLQNLLYTFKNEAELLKSIEEISFKFTQERQHIGDYLKDPRLVSAYTAFYLMTNLPKLAGVLQWMPSEWKEIIKKCDLVDLGAGPGTFSLAYKSWGGGGDVYQIETAALMREQAHKLWQVKNSSQRLFQSERWSWQNEKEKLLLFGHSANEMGVDKTIGYIETIKPQHILFIEPGTKDFFMQMLEIRDYLLRKKFNVLFPCPTAEVCPFKNSSEDWCHQFLKVSHSASVERLSQLVKKDRRHLPLTVFAFSSSFISKEPSPRLVRVLPETKFSFEWEVCEGDKVIPYQVMKRGMDKQAQKEVGQILSGAPVEVDLDKQIENKKRVTLRAVKNGNS